LVYFPSRPLKGKPNNVKVLGESKPKEPKQESQII
jgi:hypothetical protein